VREDVKMRRCEDEIQTPTIGRTLRSDALGKKQDFSATSFGTFGKIREPNNQITNNMKQNNEGTTAGFWFCSL
jgi:hypothetical protein